MVNYTQGVASLALGWFILPLQGGRWTNTDGHRRTQTDTGSERARPELVNKIYRWKFSPPSRSGPGCLLACEEIRYSFQYPKATAWIYRIGVNPGVYMPVAKYVVCTA